MEHQQIFATNIFLIDEFIPQSVKAEKKVIDDMKKYISDLWTERDYDNNWQTKSADLHTKKEFHHFSTLVRKTGMDICNKLGYDVEDLIITDMEQRFKNSEYHSKPPLIILKLARIIYNLDKELPIYYFMMLIHSQMLLC